MSEIKSDGVLENLAERILKIENQLKNGFKIVSKDGEYSVSITVDDTGAGLWIESAGGPSVSIYNGFHQGPVIGLYSEKRKEAINIGLCKNGIQFYDNKTNRARHINFNTILQLLELIEPKNE